MAPFEVLKSEPEHDRPCPLQLFNTCTRTKTPGRTIMSCFLSRLLAQELLICNSCSSKSGRGSMVNLFILPDTKSEEPGCNAAETPVIDSPQWSVLSGAALILPGACCICTKSESDFASRGESGIQEPVQ